MNLLISATITLLYPQNTDKAFAAYRSINAMFVAVGFFVSPLLTWREIAAFNLALTALVVILFFVLYAVVLRNDVTYARLNSEKEMMSHSDEECLNLEEKKDQKDVQMMEPDGMC